MDCGSQPDHHSFPFSPITVQKMTAHLESDCQTPEGTPPPAHGWHNGTLSVSESVSVVHKRPLVCFSWLTFEPQNIFSFALWDFKRPNLLGWATLDNWSCLFYIERWPEWWSACFYEVNPVKKNSLTAEEILGQTWLRSDPSALNTARI